MLSYFGSVFLVVISDYEVVSIVLSPKIYFGRIFKSIKATANYLKGYFYIPKMCIFSTAYLGINGFTNLYTKLQKPPMLKQISLFCLSGNSV